MAQAHVSSGGRYPVLRSVAILFMINAIVVVGTGAYWIYYFMTEKTIGTVSDRATTALLVLAATFFAVLLTVGLAEMIKLFMDIEHNTRSAAQSIASGKQWIEGEETAEGALLRGR
jgi:hypothetical protein